MAALAGGWLVVFAYLQVSWGGDMMRPHLRAVSDVARYSCPSCGQSLVGHLEEAVVRCPDCATRVDPVLFDPPYAVGPELRAFPPWRRRHEKTPGPPKETWR